MKRLIAVSLFASVMGAAPAMAQIYECTLTSRDAKFVAEEMTFWLPNSAQGPAVVDAVIEKVFGGPVSARVTVRSEDVLRFRWRVRNYPTSPGLANVSYRADLSLQAGTVSISGSVAGFNEDVKGRGTCRKR